MAQSSNLCPDFISRGLFDGPNQLNHGRRAGNWHTTKCGPEESSDYLQRVFKRRNYLCT